MCNDDLTSWHRSAFKVDELLTSFKLKTGLYMDTIEAKKNLEIYKRNLSRLENYNHLFSSHTFKTECQREVNTLRTRIENLENAFEKEAKRNKSATMR